MRYGLMFDTAHPIDDLVPEARKLAATGIDTLWCSQIFGYDALSLLGVLAREVPEIGFGTAVVPVYPRHPVMLAAQALTVQAASGGRLQLGIGLSHQMVIENVFGMSFDKPGRYMREYLEILMPLVRGEAAGFKGEVLSSTTFGPLDIPGASAPPVLVAALGPKMLETAGQLADGTATWMTGLSTVADHIVPGIRAAASAAGRPSPHVAVGLPVCVTEDHESAHEQASKTFAIYGQLPSYRAMLDREGAEGPADVAVIGDEAALARAIDRLTDSGATEFIAAPFGDRAARERTVAALSAIARG